MSPLAGGQHGKSAPSTPEQGRKVSQPKPAAPAPAPAPAEKVRRNTVGSKGRKVSIQDENIRNRDHNLFVKKVPRDAEACNIQAHM